MAKLEHLRNLLLAEDLDFQLKVARLRQMREDAQASSTGSSRKSGAELGWSQLRHRAAEGLDRLAARRPDLEALARDQKAVIADTKDAPPKAQMP